MGYRNGHSATGAPPSNRAVADEERPLLPGRESRSRVGSFRSHMMLDVSRERADLLLLLCYLVTGLLDSASISIWGSFASMQTGNTVYIGLGLAAPGESTRWIQSATSLGSFCIASLCFSHFHRYFSPRRRWVLCASFTFQLVLIITAAALVTFGPTRQGEGISWNVLVPISLVAFQSCGQAVASRALQYNSLNSVVLTSIYCDLFSDQELLKPHNLERNRRLSAPALLLVGAIAGGVFAHSFLGISGALWAAAFLKLVAVIAWLLWPEEHNQE